MTSTDERLTMRMGKAHVRFVEDVTLALKEVEPTKADLEEALQDQLRHGRRLLEMAETACYLASMTRLPPATRSHIELDLTVAGQAFRDMQELVAGWTHRQGESPAGAQDLAPLVADLTRYHGELAWGLRQRNGDTSPNPAVFPQVGTAEWGQMNQRRAELIRKHLRGELSEAERNEYETLQRWSLAAVDASFSRQGNALSPSDQPEASGE